MAEREAFLSKIRGRLQNRVPQEIYSPTHAPDVPWTRSGAPGEDPDIDEAPERFLQELRALGGHGQRVGDLEQARDYIMDLSARLGAKLVLRWDEEELETLGIDAPLRKAGTELAISRSPLDLKGTAARADIGITGAEYAVAETGSIAIASDAGKGRSVTLLPPTHVAVLPVERIFTTVAEALDHHAQNGRLPANLCLHSGPSRSGDIEQVLTVGVHGPGDVHVLLVG